ncbi:MAG: gamma-glutamyl-phosphate reductase, partial [Chloroflexota bacterium]
MSIKDDVLKIARTAREASFILSKIDSAVKNRALEHMADALISASTHLKAENLKDLEAAQTKGLTKAMIERLTL